MDLLAYFENTAGIGILATSDSDGIVEPLLIQLAPLDQALMDSPNTIPVQAYS